MNFADMTNRNLCVSMKIAYGSAFLESVLLWITRVVPTKKILISSALRYGDY